MKDNEQRTQQLLEKSQNNNMFSDHTERMISKQKKMVEQKRQMREKLES